MFTTTHHPSQPSSTSTKDERGRLWRSRWAAIGATVAVSLGAGGFVGLVDAASSAPSDIVSITPVRVLDTRDPNNVGLAGPFVSATGQDLTVTGNIPTANGPQQVVPPGATSVLPNVTVVNATTDGFITVRPADAPGAPSTSILDFKAGAITPSADVLVDVMGYTVAAPVAAPRTLCCGRPERCALTIDARFRHHVAAHPVRGRRGGEQPRQSGQQRDRRGRGPHRCGRRAGIPPDGHLLSS